MSRFLPIDPSQQLTGRQSPAKAFSVTFGRAFNTCRRSGYLYQKYRRKPLSTAPLERGSALHRVIELATRATIEADELMIPPDVVKAIVNEVLADPDYWCPVEEHDYIRESAYRWAEETVIDPGAVVAVETLFVLDLDGTVLRARIDFAEVLDDGARVRVRDYKSSRAMPGFEDIGRRQPDGRIAAKDFQLVAYAACLAFGRPVRVEECPHCHGRGTVDHPVSGSTTEREVEDVPAGCGQCDGTGRMEFPEPFGVAERAETFDLEYVYPGILGADDKIATRGVSLTRTEVHAYLDSLRAMAEQVRQADASRDWPASFGGHCSECTAPAECPIPRELRRHQGEINTVAEAVEAAEVLAAEKFDYAARQKEINAFIKTAVPGQRLRFGRDQVSEVGRQTRVEIKDKDGMFAAMEAAIRTGEVFDRGEWVRESVTTPIVHRRLTEAELEAEREDGRDAA